MIRLEGDACMLPATTSVTRRLTLQLVAPAGAALFVAGFFTLAARDASRDLAVYVLIALGAVLFASAVLGLTAIFAAVESLSGRAWAGGFRRLGPGESGGRAWAQRALRYATFLWLCNGAAFVVAALR